MPFPSFCFYSYNKAFRFAGKPFLFRSKVLHKVYVNTFIILFTI